MQTIGVIGAGVIGSSLSQHISSTGLNVLLLDISTAQLEEARKTIQRNMRLQVMFKKGKTEMDLGVKKGVISYLTDFHKMAEADFVIECVTEKFEIKKEVFITLDEVCNENCIIATNTSAIPVRKLAELTRRKEKVIGLHFMNPVPLIDAVEMISCPLTSESTLETTRHFLTRINKEGILVNDSPGFVSNRTLMITINEAISTLQDGVAPAASIDKIFRSCFNHKMGPLETADLIGLDTILNTLEVLQEHFGNNKFAPCTLLKTMVAAGKLGRKSGSGFYNYNIEI
jgi:3-hydroxybutyryl-CoA dehydrogenase